MGHDGRADHRLQERLCRIVFPDLVLVAHDGHLGPALLVEDQAAAEPVRLDLHGQLEMARRQRRVAVHPVVPGGHVGIRTSTHRVEDVRNALVPVCLAEVHGAFGGKQVLQQVRGAGIAGPFVARPDVIHDHERDDRRRMVPCEIDRHAVGLQPVLRERAERCDEFDVRRERRRRRLSDSDRRSRKERERDGDHERTYHGHFSLAVGWAEIRASKHGPDARAWQSVTARMQDFQALDDK